MRKEPVARRLTVRAGPGADTFGSPWASRRAGFSMLELEVAVLVFGVALMGIFPLSVMYSRQLKRFEARLDPDATYYLIPPSERWAQKLGAAATLSTDDDSTPSGTSIPAYDVQILSIDKSFTGQTVTITASVTASGP